MSGSYSAQRTEVLDPLDGFFIYLLFILDSGKDFVFSEEGFIGVYIWGGQGRVGNSSGINPVRLRTFESKRLALPW